MDANHLFSDPSNTVFVGGCSCILAFMAINKLDLAIANTLMFTMPLWTALFAYLFIGKAWDR